MEKPKCRTCQARHWPKDGCWGDKPKTYGDLLPQLVGHLMKASDLEPLPKSRLAEVAPLPKSRLKEPKAARRFSDDAEPDNWANCPHCAARRAKDAKRVQKYRARNKGEV